MELRHYATCFWPGLPELWWRGRLSALPAAVGFALALNALLIARFLFPEWFSAFLVRFAFWIGVAAWFMWSMRSVKELPVLLQPRTVSTQPDCFDDARAAYLKGNWDEAEGLLADVLAVESRDPPALLLLAGVYRHSGRLEAATTLLQEVERLEVADAWAMELAGEVARLARAIEQAKAESPEAESSPQEISGASKTESGASNTESASTIERDVENKDNRQDRHSDSGSDVSGPTGPNAAQGSRPDQNNPIKKSSADRPRSMDPGEAAEIHPAVTVTAEEVDRLLSDSSLD